VDNEDTVQSRMDYDGMVGRKNEWPCFLCSSLASLLRKPGPSSQLLTLVEENIQQVARDRRDDRMII
jgi:hypothetical protein